MPTQSTTYNSRVTDESLEKRFRDTFRSQGGAELVDDLYAQGVIVPIVDFTAAATGQQLAQNLQTARDSSMGSANIDATTYQTLVTNAGFWLVDVIYAGSVTVTSGATFSADIAINDGLANNIVWTLEIGKNAPAVTTAGVVEESFVVFLRSTDSLVAKTALGDSTLNLVYRQIATVSGDLVNPTGFTSS